MKRTQQHVLKRERVQRLSPRLHQLEILLSHGPQTIHQLVNALGLKTDTCPDPVATVRTYLSKLGKLATITVHFQYGASTYEILQKKSIKST